MFLLSSLFDFGEKLDFLTSSQQSNTLSYQLQSSYPGSQPPPPQHLRQPQASLPHTAYLTPSPYLTPSAPDSNLTSYMTFGPGGNSSGVVTYSTGGQAYVQSQSAGQLLLQSAGHHGELTRPQRSDGRFSSTRSSVFEAGDPFQLHPSSEQSP